ncbi:hypothetical protein Ptr902_09836 [Pyrenophora tritici-repentis]|nr:hypothetical protein Ptr902_09836 [Pyrenophora tritici-repentis]
MSIILFLIVSLLLVLRLLESLSVLLFLIALLKMAIEFAEKLKRDEA